MGNNKSQKYLIVSYEGQSEDFPLLEFLTGLLGNSIRYEIRDTHHSPYHVIYHDFKDDILIAEGLKSFGMEMFVEFKAFASNEFIDKNKMEENINIISEILLSPEIANGFYCERELLKSKIILKDNRISKMILKEYYEDQQMHEIIIAFLESNMNTSLTSKKLYFHRNTLINKLDKFYEKTGYDLRNFKDAYLIYSLIKN